jgi:hypothetical protein
MKLLAFAALLASAACSSNDAVSSAADARRAYFGLDVAIDRALNLGMKGYNDASSANIPAESGNGDVAGTLTVSGQVDQGQSPNKEMRLKTAFAAYQDRLPPSDAGAGAPYGVTYDTDAAVLPELDLSLRNIPNGTFTGTFTGKVIMSGDLKGAVTLALTFSGTIQAVPGQPGKIQRSSVHVTGTATSDYGTYAVSVDR